MLKNDQGGRRRRRRGREGGKEASTRQARKLSVLQCGCEQTMDVRLSGVKNAERKYSLPLCSSAQLSQRKKKKKKTFTRLPIDAKKIPGGAGPGVGRDSIKLKVKDLLAGFWGSEQIRTWSVKTAELEGEKKKRSTCSIWKVIHVQGEQFYI